MYQYSLIWTGVLYRLFGQDNFVRIFKNSKGLDSNRRAMNMAGGNSPAFIKCFKYEHSSSSSSAQIENIFINAIYRRLSWQTLPLNLKQLLTT